MRGTGMVGIDIERGLNEAWFDVASFVPKIAAFLVIVLIGDVVAMVLARVVQRVLTRIGFDGWVERGALGGVFERMGVEASDLLSMVTFWVVLLFALTLAFGVFGPNPISDLLEAMIAYLPNVFAAVVVLVIAGALGGVVSDVLGSMLSSMHGGAVLARLAGLAIIVVGVFAALDQLQIAPAIVIGVFYAVLAMVVGVFIVAVGAGGMPTMRRYWERAGTAVETGAARAAREVAVDPPKEVMADAPQEEAEVEREPTIPIDGPSGWKPPRARGYQLGASST